MKLSSWFSGDSRWLRGSRRTVLAAGLAVGAAIAVPGAAQAASDFVYASNTYGYAGASFDWSGPGSVTNIDLIVSDWECDSNPVYAKFRVNRTNNTYWTTSTERWDYSGCDEGDYTTFNNLTISDGYNIKTIQVEICVRNGSCHWGGVSGINPYS